MSKSNYKVICFILAVFLLLVGAPFFGAQAKLMSCEVSDVLENKSVVTNSSVSAELETVFTEETADISALVNPMAAPCYVKNQNSQRLFSPYLIFFYIAIAAFALMNKSFFPMGRYISYNYVRYFLIALKVIHRADGKCRSQFLYV